MFAIDEIAYASPAKSWPPLGKLLLTLSLLISSLIAGTIIIPLVVLAIGGGMLAYSTRFRFPRVVALALLDGVVVIAVGAAIIALVTGGTPIWQMAWGPLVMAVSAHGLDLAVLVFVRAIAGVTVMLFFATSTPIPHFAHAMRRLRIPVEISELVILVYRYSFLILEESERMYVAATCRLGFVGFRNSLRTTAKLAVGMFIRSIEMAERSQIALCCRNFKGDFPTYRPPARTSMGWVIVSILSFIILFESNLLLTRGVLGW